MSFLAPRALAFVGLSLMISACAGASGPARGAGEVGKPAPALAIQSLNGKGAVSLTAAPGKVAIVGFFATWRAPCKASLARLEALSKSSGGKVDVIGISVDDTTRGVVDFANAQGVSFPIAWDENHTLMRRWNVETMPTTFILDDKGNVRFVHQVEKDDDADLIAREVAQLTDQSPVSSPKTEVASASVPAAPVPVPVTDAPPSTEATSAGSSDEVAQASKPKTKPSSVKKGAPKKPTTKKSAAPADKAKGA